jgi:hypothetical protein
VDLAELPIGALRCKPLLDLDRDAASSIGEMHRVCKH